jgi:choline dehydrogenase-like flavoprotein
VDRLNQNQFEVRGRVVLLCASTIETIRILLNTKNRGATGTANGCGVLGQYLMDHMAVTVSGFVPDSQRLSRYPLGGPDAIYIPRFRNVDGCPIKQFVRGYGIWAGMQRGSSQEDFRAGGSRGAPWFMTAVLEVLPRATNSVVLNTNRVDAFGIPTVNIHLEYGDNEERMKNDAMRTMLEMADAAGFTVNRVHVSAPGRYVHELGGARMGTDPAISVVDEYNECWEFPNLFVLDGASFVTSGWQNPTLTILAITARACDAIIRGPARFSS